MLLRTCDSGRSQEALAGRFGDVSVKCGHSVTMMKCYKNSGQP